MNPPDLLRLGVIDGVIQEPKGGAHRDWTEAARLLGNKLNLKISSPSSKSGKAIPKN